jgi:hypothetical protein
MTVKETTMLKTRKVTGVAPWPIMLLVGEPKTGKTHTAASMAASPSFGRVLMIEIGERSADAYGALFPELETMENPVRTWRELQAAVDSAVADPTFNSGDQEHPNVLIVDSMSEAWAELRSTADRDAVARFVKRNKNADIPADLKLGMDQWNSLNSAHGKLLHSLTKFNGLVVLTARGGWVSVMDSNGQPTKDKTWKTEGNRKLEFAATATIRCESPGVATLRGMTSPGAEPVPATGIACPEDQNPIEWVLSRLPGRGSFAVVELAAGLISTAHAKQAVVDACDGDTNKARAVWAANPLLAELGKDDSVDETFIAEVVAGIPAELERLAVVEDSGDE